MRKFLGLTLLVVLLAQIILVLPASAADPTTGSTGDASTMQSPELRLLRSQVRQLQKDLADAKAEITQLKAKLVAVGIGAEEAKDTAASPNARPKRVVFAIDYTDYSTTAARDEVRRAIAELQPDQWFNVVLTTAEGPRPFSTTMLPATPTNREKGSAFAGSQMARCKPEDSLAAALQFHPQVVYFIGIGVDDATRDEVKKRNAGVNAKVNTTTAFGISSLAQQRVLWQIARDTGGVCVDSKGNAVDEPVLPVRIDRPEPKPATKPSIFGRNP